jgi:hypothetical protein
VCSGFHRRDRRGFADAAGDDDEGQIQFAGLQNLECLRRAELRQIVVREDDVPRFLTQGAVHSIAGFHALRNDVVTTLADVARNHLGVELGVLDDQNTQRGLHGSRTQGR